MNCKQNDIAIIINGETGIHTGKPCTVIKFLGYVPEYLGNDRWEIDVEITSACGEIINHRQDCNLMPIGNTKNQKAVAKEKPVEVE